MFEGSELCLPEYPRVKVSFPQNAVEKKEEVQVIVKVRARRLDDISLCGSDHYVYLSRRNFRKGLGCV